MDKPYNVNPDTVVLPSHLPLPLPGLGYISINSYLIKAREPVLVDTGMKIEPEAWLKALESVIDPGEIRWIWITHDDADHTGNIQDILKLAPNAKLVTNIIGVARMETSWPIHLDQCYLLKQGESLDVGDRSLTAFRPPLFDSPATMGLYDDKTRTCFSSDCFGTFIPEVVQSAADVPEQDLMQGFGIFNKANHPWVHLADEAKLAKVLNAIQEMAPETILSAHLPAARGMADKFLKTLATLPASDPFDGLNQAEVEAIMAQVNEGHAPGSH